MNTVKISDIFRADKIEELYPKMMLLSLTEIEGLIELVGQRAKDESIIDHDHLRDTRMLKTDFETIFFPEWRDRLGEIAVSIRERNIQPQKEGFDPDISLTPFEDS